MKIFKRKEKLPKKYKEITCLIKFKQKLYSDKAEVEMYGSDMDIEIGLIGIFLAYINRGHSFDDIREIIEKVELGGGIY